MSLKEKSTPLIKKHLLYRACLKYGYEIISENGSTYTLRSLIQKSILPIILIVQNCAGEVQVRPKLGSSERYTPTFDITTDEQIECLKKELAKAKQDANLFTQCLTMPSITKTKIAIGKTHSKMAYKVAYTCPHCGKEVSGLSTECPHCKKEYYNSTIDRWAVKKLRSRLKLRDFNLLTYLPANYLANRQIELEQEKQKQEQEQAKKLQIYYNTGLR